MFRDLIGVQEQIANKIDAVLLERKAQADCRIGRQMSALFNGFQEDFMGKVLIAEANFSARSLVAAVSSEYILSNCSKHFILETGTDTHAEAGLVEPDGTTRRGLLRLKLDNAVSAAMGFHQEDVYWLHGNQSFEIKVALDACSGLDLPASEGAFQFGVMEEGTNGVTTVADVPSVDYAYVELTAGKARIVASDDGGTASSPWVKFDFPNGRIVVGLMWGAQGRTLHLTINDKIVTSLQIAAADTIVGNKLQLFGRVGHTATYTTTAGGNPLHVDIESIQAIMYNNAAAPYRSE